MRSFFRAKLTSANAPYYGLRVRVNRPAPVTASIAQIESSEDFVHAVLGALIWYSVADSGSRALTLLIAAFSLCQGLRPTPT